MRIPTRYWKRLGFGLVGVIAVLACIRVWVIPALIVRQLQGMTQGKVTIRDWWLNGTSAGVVGLTLHEGPGSRSPVWATAERVTTDLSLPGVLVGQFSPGRIKFQAPVFRFRIDRQGRFQSRIGFKSGGGGGSSSAVPLVVASDAQIVIRQEGRPEMVVKRVQGRLAPDGKVERLSLRTDDPNWGAFEASGEFDPSFQSGRIELKSGSGVAIDLEKAERIPFVPKEVWTNVVPQGTINVRLTMLITPPPQGSVQVRTVIGLRQTILRTTALDLIASNATGEFVIEGGVVKLNHVAGRAIDGRVEANGTLDFTRESPRFDLAVNLERINVADAPKSWQLYEAGVTGHLTGSAQLRAVLAAKGVDLSGSTGEAVVEGGTIQGIPVKSLRLTMRAEGDDLQFATKAKSSAETRVLPRSRLTSGAVASRVSYQSPPVKEEEPPKAKPHHDGMHLPKSITTQLELEDVDIAQLIAKLQLLLGLPFPLPVAGKLSIKADATIPLGKLRDVKDYAFHGDVTLKGASIDKVDFGRLAARVDLADGMLDLTNLRGRLVDHPNGGPDNPPATTEPVIEPTGPLPRNGFRGSLHAEISPAGLLAAKFEGDQLPLGELGAPFLPRPTPVSGLVTLQAEAHADLTAATNPKAWTASGHLESVEVRYLGEALDRLSLRFNLKKGQLDIRDLAAELSGHPLTAQLGLELSPPHTYNATVDVSGWDLAEVLGLIPGAPHPAPIAGKLNGHAVARGTLTPWSIQTDGRGRLGQFQAGPVRLGDIPFHWETERDMVVISGVEAHPFGGHLKAGARVPIVAGKATVGEASLTGIDTALLAASMPDEGLKLTGKADGQIRFVVPPGHASVEATVKLSAPDLTVQGVAAEQMHASVRAHRGTLKYEVTADSLGGKIKLEGDMPLNTPASKAGANGEFRAVNFTLGQALKAVGVSGAAAQLQGLGAIDANLRTSTHAGSGVWVHGVAEFRDLRWGEHFPLGYLRGIVARSPAAWRVEPLTGELLGGPAAGFIYGTTPAKGPGQVDFDVKIERAVMKQALGLVPILARNVDGFASMRLIGELNDALHANAEIHVPRSRVFGLPLSELHAPAEVVLAPGTGSGVLNVHRWSARVAGGHAHGDARFHLGANHSFQGNVELTGVDLETLARIESDTRRPASGQISGRITLAGPSLAQLQRMRGKVVLDLTDASLVALPVFRELDKFLGAARGGLFEDGDLTGTIANRQLIVEMLTLVGRLVQMHATGTVGFDGQLNLEVLVSTNQIIPHTGEALVSAIPGLRDAVGRNTQVSSRVNNYLSNRLLKLRVTGSISSPSVSIDPSIAVADTAMSFFAGVLKLPMGLIK